MIEYADPAANICNDVEQITMTVPWIGSLSLNIASDLVGYQPLD